MSRNDTTPIVLFFDRVENSHFYKRLTVARMATLFVLFVWLKMRQAQFTSKIAFSFLPLRLLRPARRLHTEFYLMYPIFPVNRHLLSATTASKYRIQLPKCDREVLRCTTWPEKNLTKFLSTFSSTKNVLYYRKRSTSNIEARIECQETLDVT